jgi:hypothetical protein
MDAHNSPSFRSLVVVCLLAVAVPNLAACQPPKQDCEARALAAQVVRTDPRSRRLFVLSTERDLLEATTRARVLRDLESLVKGCQPAWGQDWAISFFSDATSVGYKDDEALSAQVASGQWARAYLGEFAMPERSLTVYPAEPTRSRSFTIE